VKSWWILNSTVVAAQDQAINTNYFKNKILKEEIESKCRLRKQHEEIIDHITSGCPHFGEE
jgi:prenyltransferase beta subunit